MSIKRRIEIFSAGCPLCARVVREVEAKACPSCEVIVLDMSEAHVAERAESLGVHSVPALAIDGVLAGCCAGRGLDWEVLRAAGLGRAGF